MDKFIEYVLGGGGPGFLEHDPLIWELNAKNYCLGWHHETFKHHNSEETFIFEDIRICNSIFLFCNFQLEVFTCGLGK
jgi:hypothetical protein